MSDYIYVSEDEIVVSSDSYYEMFQNTTTTNTGISSNSISIMSAADNDNDDDGDDELCMDINLDSYVLESKNYKLLHTPNMFKFGYFYDGYAQKSSNDNLYLFKKINATDVSKLDAYYRAENVKIDSKYVKIQSIRDYIQTSDYIYCLFECISESIPYHIKYTENIGLEHKIKIFYYCTKLIAACCAEKIYPNVKFSDFAVDNGGDMVLTNLFDAIVQDENSNNQVGMGHFDMDLVEFLYYSPEEVNDGDYYCLDRLLSWRLGVILYYLCFDKYPFYQVGMSLSKVVKRLKKLDFELPKQNQDTNETIPDYIVSLLERLLVKSNKRLYVDQIIIYLDTFSNKNF